MPKKAKTNNKSIICKELGGRFLNKENPEFPKNKYEKLKAKGWEGLKRASQKRDDDFINTLSSSNTNLVHKDCRRNYIQIRKRELNKVMFS